MGSVMLVLAALITMALHVLLCRAVSRALPEGFAGVRWVSVRCSGHNRSAWSMQYLCGAVIEHADALLLILERVEQEIHAGVLVLRLGVYAAEATITTVPPWWVNRREWASPIWVIGMALIAH